MITAPVPDFFLDESEEALRSRQDWLGEYFGLGDDFFARFLRIDEGTLRTWRLGEGPLGAKQQQELQDFWTTAMHILSFAGMDDERVRSFLSHLVAFEPENRRHPHMPRWMGSCLRDYLGEQGADALPYVDEWIMAPRFGKPYER